MKKIRLTAIAAMMTAALTLNTGCDDLFDPAIENHKDASALEELPAWAVGMLGHAYISNPLGSWSFNDVATDDAVSNDPGNSYRKMATGSWRANDNPMDRWQHLRASWQYINQFIEVTDKVNWAADPLVAEMFKERFKGDLDEEKLIVGIRPEYFEISENPLFKAKIESVELIGKDSILNFNSNGIHAKAITDIGRKIQQDDEIGFSIDYNNIYLFKENGARVY